jgi:phosphoribosylformimino-5-aminoimidazole carboxamide ribotide isomerase
MSQPITAIVTKLQYRVRDGRRMVEPKTPTAPDRPPVSRDSMRVVGVIDILGGRSVHARGGRRSEYAPVATAAGLIIDGDPVALARAYVDALGVRELYVADLDAIERGTGAMQAESLAGIAAVGVPMWVDAGASTVHEARLVLGTGASIVVIGLETLRRFDSLGEICSAVGPLRVAFSLDVRDGVPIRAPNVADAGAAAAGIAERAAETAVRSIIVLDLGRVGTGAGIDLDLIADVRRAAPDVALFAGGGVRETSDLAALAGLGCDGALIATALLTGDVKV